MSTWEKMKAKLRSFMVGRNGPDDLSLALLITALILSIFSTFGGNLLLNLLSTIAYVYCIFRMLSRNTVKRRAENQRFITWKYKFTTAIKQYWVRLKNIRKYKYFKCPQCNALLRLPRKVGEVNVTCSKCRHVFKKKA